MLRDKLVTDIYVDMNGGIYAVLKERINLHLSAVITLINDSEEILEAKRSTLQKEYNKEIEDGNAFEYSQQYADHLFEDDFEIRYVIIYQTLYNSIFLSMFSLLEISLKELYIKIDTAKNKGQKYHFGNANLKDIVKAYTEIGIPLSEQAIWNTITDYQHLRNAVAHRNSYMISDKNKTLEQNRLYGIVEKNTDLAIINPDAYFIIANKNFLFKFKDTITNLFDQLDDPIYAIIPSWKTH